MTAKEYILAPNAVQMLNSMRALGYSFETAIADIVDNSISANAKNIEILYEENPTLPAYIAILDDGHGMNHEMLINALQHACHNPNDKRTSNDLGRFGLGLKTASLSQCRILTVASKQQGVISAAEWDLDLVEETKNWTIRIYDEDMIQTIPKIDLLENRKEGTLVVWRNFDRLNSRELDTFQGIKERLAYAKDYLSLIYHRLLQTTENETDNNKITIKINDILLRPKDPFAESFLQTTQDTPLQIIRFGKGNCHSMKAQGFTIPNKSEISNKEYKKLGLNDRALQEDQGFYIYRNHRLISWGDWLGLKRKAQLTTLSRVRIDIDNSMDDLWELNIKKSKACPPKQVKEALSKYLDAWMDNSIRILRSDGSIVIQKISSSPWLIRQTSDDKKSFVIEIDKNNLFYTKLISHLEPEVTRLLNAYLSLLEKLYPVEYVYSKLMDDGRISYEKESKKIEKDLSNSLSTLIEGFKSSDKCKVLEEFTKLSKTNEAYSLLSKIARKKMSEKK